MSPRICTLVALMLACSAVSHAQVGRDVAERGSNRSQISQGKSDAERDASELGGFSERSAALGSAIEAGDTAAANEALKSLSPLLSAEVQQAASKAEAAKRELAGAASETGSNRRESRRSRDDSDAYGRSDDDAADAARDGLNRADDARDLADDKKDLEAIVSRAQRQQQIAESLAGQTLDLASEAGRSEATSKLALIDEFGQLMQQDLEATQQEIAEDKKEAGEDRRETRDDVREADEPDNRYRRETGDAGRRR